VLFELLGDAKYLDATPAFLAALHTWGRSLSLHPHVHVLIADGGLDDNGVWVRPRRSHFLPARVLMMLFRGKLLAALREGSERAQLRLPPDLSRERFSSLLNRLGRVKWNVRLCTRYTHGEGVAAYLARYLKGGALKNTQLVAADASCVRFRYTPHRDEHDSATEPMLMTLSPDAFLDRYLAHIAPPRLQSVRGYGLYGQRQGAALDCARAALGQAPVAEPEALSAEKFLARFEHTPQAARCPQCSALLRFVSALPHGTGPPQPLH
jgi:hypothetical protein